MSVENTFFKNNLQRLVLIRHNLNFVFVMHRMNSFSRFLHMEILNKPSSGTFVLWSLAVYVWEAVDSMASLSRVVKFGTTSKKR